MKKIVYMAVAIIVMALMGCTKQNTPELVAEEFLKAVYTADFTKAKKLCTEESQQVIDFVAAFASESTERMKKSDVTCEIVSSNIAEDGNSAKVVVKVKGTYDLQKKEIVEQRDEKLNLVKVDKKWLVDYKLK